MRTTSRNWINPYIYGSYLFDLQNDPLQEHPIFDSEIEKRMIKLMRKEMEKNDAPIEQYERLGIPLEGEITDDHCLLTENRAGIKDKIGNAEIVWKNKGKSAFFQLLNYLPKPIQNQWIIELEKKINDTRVFELDENFLLEAFSKWIPKNAKAYFNTLINIVRRKAK